MNAAWQKMLQPAVAAKYEATVHPARIEIQRLGRIVNLRTMDVAEADALVQDPQFTYLKRKKGRKGRTLGETAVN